SPVGAKITVYTANRKHVGQIITGESIHAQHAPVQHFGLGRTTRVEKIEVRWPNGGPLRVIDNPAIDRYHTVTAGPAAAK
ncbi:MAG: ASPIC/UnbV domain-containing protein, partial [Planctomycetes bacterium]|nr:ASPIC/UnbV domain-containing protein [Planctomycetota bacterium]